MLSFEGSLWREGGGLWEGEGKEKGGGAGSCEGWREERRGRKAGEGQLARAECPELEGERTTHTFSSSTQQRDQGPPPPPARDMPINPLPRWGKQSPDRCDSACPSPLNVPPSPPHTIGHLSAWELVGPDLPPQGIQKAPLLPTFSLQPHSTPHSSCIHHQAPYWERLKAHANPTFPPIPCTHAIPHLEVKTYT